jgi:hypothetical protein
VSAPFTRGFPATWAVRFCPLDPLAQDSRGEEYLPSNPIEPVDLGPPLLDLDALDHAGAARVGFVPAAVRAAVALDAEAAGAAAGALDGALADDAARRDGP